MESEPQPDCAEMEVSMKIAVFFPGIGYHCDKPLLYYSGKIAGQQRYELYRLSYTGLKKQMDDLDQIIEEAFEQAYEQTEQALRQIEWQRYEEILFVSKSIGTIMAAAYAERHGINCRNVYYTPLARTFDFNPRSGIVFHGTNDPWAKTAVIEDKCREYKLPLYIVDRGNHSLEVKDDTLSSLRALLHVMDLTERYVKDGIYCRRLRKEELCRELFAGFVRHQRVGKCRRKENGIWIVKDDPFIDDWTEADYQFLVTCLVNTVNTGGFVYAAFDNGILKGFASVESVLFGGENRYLDLSSIHVSEDMRGRGIGRLLFAAAAAWARQRGACKLYISSHSAVETQAFYRAMGCVEAQEYNKEHVDREPYDCQLEYVL